MPDNVTIPASGTGDPTPIVATDQVGTAHYQKVKLVDGTADSAAAIPGDAANGLDVDVTRLPSLPAGTNNIGDVDIVSLPDEGQQTMAGSISVAVASDQSTLPMNLKDLQSVALAGPFDVDSGAGTQNVLGVSMRKAASGGSVEYGTSTDPLRVDPTGTTTQPVSGTVNIGTFPDNEPFNLSQLAGTALAVPFDVDSGAGTQNVAGVSLRKAAAGGSVEYGTSTDPLRVDPTGTTTQPVSGTVTANAGTGVFDVTPVTPAATDYLPVRVTNGTSFDPTRVVAGDVADDAPDSGNPIKVGARARNTLGTAVAANDRVDLKADRFGRLLVASLDIGMRDWKAASFTTTQTGTAIWTPALGKRIWIHHVNITTGGTTAARVTLWFGASADTTYTEGTDPVIFDGEFAPSATSRPGAIIDYSQTGPLGAIDDIVKITTSAAITVYVQLFGFELTP